MPDPSRTDISVPDGAWLGAVLLHPHPSYGGDRRNVVVEALWRALAAAGSAAVRFDFRSDDLDRCANEAVEALDLLPADLPLAIVGYSFGAAVASQVADQRLVAWALVAPPFGRMLPAAEAPIGADERPKLLLVPAHDQFCTPASARTEIAGWASTTVEEVPSADHFLAGSTAAVADRAVSWLRDHSEGSALRQT